MNQVKYCDLIDCENNEDARSGHRMVVINDILYVIGNYDLNPIPTMLDFQPIKMKQLLVSIFV